MSPELIAILAVGASLAGLMLTLVGRLDRRIDRLDQRLERRMDGLDQRIDRLDQWMDRLEARIGALDERLTASGRAGGPARRAARWSPRSGCGPAGGAIEPPRDRLYRHGR